MKKIVAFIFHRTPNHFILWEDFLMKIWRPQNLIKKLKNLIKILSKFLINVSIFIQLARWRQSVLIPITVFIVGRQIIIKQMLKQWNKKQKLQFWLQYLTTDSRLSDHITIFIAILWDFIAIFTRFSRDFSPDFIVDIA